MSNSVKERTFMSYDVKQSEESTSSAKEAINDLSEPLQTEYNYYMQYKTIFNVLEEFARQEDCGDSENDKLKSKVYEIIVQESLAQTTRLGDLEDDILGVKDVNSLSLTYLESRRLEEIVKKKLIEKQCQLTNKNGMLDKNKSKLLTSDPSLNELIENKNQLIALKQEYVKNLLTLAELMTELKEMRLNELPQALEMKIEEWTLSGKICNLKARLLTSKNRVDAFTETSTSLEAYKQLVKDIKREQRVCEEEIENLKQLKRQYEQVSCKQYDEILKSYLEYKAALERKKLLYSRFKDKV
ncbi:unnamed protein product [Acanthoscelides obtectus]|uniref:Uncharacterized protein n=1 Tax=Acanthoscelides obtectus TaxID=200917 RepID=A0A9P0KWF0_ACAOB|nr:unnamed protein product [Acanthoscelides obtectus]CAK1676247.1 hypothetical protein AOBTE_LOCUS30665 [Acanthoscelides obtectus]